MKHSKFILQNNSMVPTPFTKGSDVAKNVLKAAWSSTHVGVTCDGEVGQGHMYTNYELK